MKEVRLNDVSWIHGAVAMAFVAFVAAGGVASTYLPIEATNWPGMQPSLDTSPKPAAPLAPAASPIPSIEAASPTPSPVPTPPPQVPTGSGQWNVNGATVKAGGAFAAEIDSGGSVFTMAGSAAHGAWSVRFGVSGEGPASLRGVASGPNPFVIDATVQIFRLPISVRGTPGKDLSVSVGTPAGRFLDQAQPVAAVHSPVVLAESPAQTATRIIEDTIRGAVAFTLVGWLLLLIAPGLRQRSYSAARSSPFRRLGLGAILVIDVPLAALLLAIVGIPLGLWWIGLVALAIFVAVAFAGYAFAGFQIGVLLLGRSDRAIASWMLEVPVGVTLLVLAGQIPYAGPVISILAVVYGMGSMLYSPAEPKEALVPTITTTLMPADAPPASQRPLVE